MAGALRLDLPVGLMWPNKLFCSTECTLSTEESRDRFFCLVNKIKNKNLQKGKHWFQYSVTSEIPVTASHVMYSSYSITC